MPEKNLLALARRVHGRRTRAEAEPASSAPSGNDAQNPPTQNPAAPRERPESVSKRPRTPADPAGTNESTLWPDLWAAHRC
ncbi:hypothetical protein OG417_48500 [Actinoallomurus sp. NBC_01490]|jgi:hypothetical protein|uniref:hypothetical protein n=1 Tax=Actinoallomurus sp. NBC_01490 TaxID=2903557 RepID=UPI002E33675E|nr:hypothetical protein [Actinoallomurus sp. NBC_01490]